MNKFSKSEEPQGTRRPTPQPFRINRTAERTRAHEPDRVDRPSRAASPTRYHEPARRE